MIGPYNSDYKRTPDTSDRPNHCCAESYLQVEKWLYLHHRHNVKSKNLFISGGFFSRDSKL